jgi:hypothetical protein
MLNGAWAVKRVRNGSSETCFICLRVMNRFIGILKCGSLTGFAKIDFDQLVTLARFPSYFIHG